MVKWWFVMSVRALLKDRWQRAAYPLPLAAHRRRRARRIYRATTGRLDL